jgi:hypothetical protein
MSVGEVIGVDAGTVLSGNVLDVAAIPVPNTLDKLHEGCANPGSKPQLRSVAGGEGDVGALARIQAETLLAELPRGRRERESPPLTPIRPPREIERSGFPSISLLYAIRPEIKLEVRLEE